MRRALELLCQLSPRQASVGDSLVNKGRIVVVTALESDNRYQQLVSAVEQQLAAVNAEAGAAAAAGQAGVMPLSEVEVSVLHTQPSSAGDIGLRWVAFEGMCLSVVTICSISGLSRMW